MRQEKKLHSKINMNGIATGKELFAMLFAGDRNPQIAIIKLLFLKY